MRRLVIFTVCLLALITAVPVSGHDGEHPGEQIKPHLWIYSMELLIAKATRHCPRTYELEGQHFTYYPWASTTEISEAMQAQCGRRYELGRWRTRDYTDTVTGDTTKLAWMSGNWVGDKDWLNADFPEFGIQCRDNRLGIWVYTGGHVGAIRDRVPVVYAIGDEAGIEQRWWELIRGTESSAGAWMADSYRGRFVQRLRDNPVADFTIRVFGYDGAAVGTATFNLTGIELQVEPVLEACEW